MRARITRDPIDPAAVMAAVGDDRDGAALLFLGVVRNHNDGRAVSGMSYDAYVEMAESVLDDILEEAANRSGSDRLFAVHRIGALAVGEPSVAIAVSTPHRAEAYDASRYVIEQIKQRLPVWKREHYVEGGERWLDGVTPSPSPAPSAGAAGGPE